MAFMYKNISPSTYKRNIVQASNADKVKYKTSFSLRYTSQRQQFGPPGSAEIAVLDYQSTQTHVIPMLSTCYALHFSKVRPQVSWGGCFKGNNVTIQIGRQYCDATFML